MTMKERKEDDTTERKEGRKRGEFEIQDVSTSGSNVNV